MHYVVVFQDLADADNAIQLFMLLKMLNNRYGESGACVKIVLVGRPVLLGVAANKTTTQEHVDHSFEMRHCNEVFHACEEGKIRDEKKKNTTAGSFQDMILQDSLFVNTVCTPLRLKAIVDSACFKGSVEFYDGGIATTAEETASCLLSPISHLKHVRDYYFYNPEKNEFVTPSEYEEILNQLMIKFPANVCEPHLDWNFLLRRQYEVNYLKNQAMKSYRQSAAGVELLLLPIEKLVTSPEFKQQNREGLIYLMQLAPFCGLRLFFEALRNHDNDFIAWNNFICIAQAGCTNSHVREQFNLAADPLASFLALKELALRQIQVYFVPREICHQFEFIAKVFLLQQASNNNNNNGASILNSLYRTWSYAIGLKNSTYSFLYDPYCNYVLFDLLMNNNNKKNEKKENVFVYYPMQLVRLNKTKRWVIDSHVIENHWEVEARIKSEGRDFTIGGYLVDFTRPISDDLQQSLIMQLKQLLLILS